MKSFFAKIGLSAFVFCAAQAFSQVSVRSLTAQASPAAQTPESNVQALFSRDMMPVDGALVQVIFKEGQFGGTDVILSTETLRGGAKEEVVAINLTCEFDIFSVACERDDRPVDGVFVKVSSVKSRNGTYKIDLERSYLSRKLGREVVELKTLAQGLQRDL